MKEYLARLHEGSMNEPHTPWFRLDAGDMEDALEMIISKLIDDAWFRGAITHEENAEMMDEILTREEFTLEFARMFIKTKFGLRLEIMETVERILPMEEIEF